MLSLIGLILFGLVTGVVARILLPGRDRGSMLVTIVLGIAGSLVGAYLGRLIGLYGPGQGGAFLMALLGAITLLVCYDLTFRRT